MKYLLAPPQTIHELGQRANQEDSIFPPLGEATESDRLFIVCDGMGGHEKGEVASNTVCQAISDFVLQETTPEELFTVEQFNAALNVAYAQLDLKDDLNTAKKMGTTLTFLKFHKRGCMIAHIGDSRIYHIRPSEGYIVHTRDHSLVNDLYDVGELTLEEMKTSKQKNVITRAMQPHQERRSKADIRNITDIRPGDYFYLCSDGMLEEMDDQNLLNILSDTETTDEDKCQILIGATENNRDNHSAYLIHVLEVTMDQDDCPVATMKTEKNSEYSQVEVQDLPRTTASQLEESNQQEMPSCPTSSSRGLLPKNKWMRLLTLGLLGGVVFLLAYLLTVFFLKQGKTDAKEDKPKTEQMKQQKENTPKEEPKKENDQQKATAYLL